MDRGTNITLNGLRGISRKAMGNPRHSSSHTSRRTHHCQARDITQGEQVYLTISCTTSATLETLIFIFELQYPVGAAGTTNSPTCNTPRSLRGSRSKEYQEGEGCRPTPGLAPTRTPTPTALHIPLLHLAALHRVRGFIELFAVMNMCVFF